MVATVARIMELMERIAPSRLAESWDNAGLQAGDPDWPVRKVWTALDPLPAVVAAACEGKIDMLVTHHPIIFKPLSAIRPDRPAGASLLRAIASHLAIFSAHTNLDSAPGGLNDHLAARLGLTDIRPLTPIPSEAFKLVVFVPRSHEEQLLKALWETPAGRIGPYDRCSFRAPGVGAYRPLENARPFRGAVGETEQAEEVRLEVLAAGADLAGVIAHLKRHHPYETMAHDIYPLRPGPGDAGLGRVGRLAAPESLSDLARRVKSALGATCIKIAGDPAMTARTVAVCAGSGASLMDDFLASGAEVYVTGELKHNNAIDAATAGRGVIDAGHFATEHPAAYLLAEKLSAMADAAGLDVAFSACPLEKDPFGMI